MKNQINYILETKLSVYYSPQQFFLFHIDNTELALVYCMCHIFFVRPNLYHENYIPGNFIVDVSRSILSELLKWTAIKILLKETINYISL